MYFIYVTKLHILKSKRLSTTIQQGKLEWDQIFARKKNYGVGIVYWTIAKSHL